jgi:hypothetical protein
MVLSAAIAVLEKAIDIMGTPGFAIQDSWNDHIR